jgi:carbon-monoxide dehydrogenase medium subunit
VKVLTDDLEAKAFAGGQTFIPILERCLNKPAIVVDLAKLGLSGITVSGDTVTIGAMTTHATIANSPEIKAKIPGLQH